MRRFVFTAASLLLCAGLLCVGGIDVPHFKTERALAQSMGLDFGIPTSVPSSGAPFALDSATGLCATSGGTNALTLPAITTVYSNDLFYVSSTENGGPILSISGISGFTPRIQVPNSSQGANAYDEFWTAKVASPISSTAVTVHTTTSDFITACIFAISGTHYAAPFDGNVLIPNSTIVLGNPASFTTSNSTGGMLISEGRGANATFAGSTGFTLIYGQNFHFDQFDIVNSAQTAFTPTGTNCCNSSLSDAIIQGP